jgi:hypothetical protein
VVAEMREVPPAVTECPAMARFPPISFNRTAPPNRRAVGITPLPAAAVGTSTPTRCACACVEYAVDLHRPAKFQVLRIDDGIGDRIKRPRFGRALVRGSRLA